MDLVKLNAEITTAAMLIELGVTTAERVKALFASHGHDDELLGEIMGEVDRRLARRG